MKIESFTKAQNDIETFFNEDNNISYTRNDLMSIFENNREKWEIANYRNYKHFLSFLEEKHILTKEELIHQSTNSIKKLWNKGNVSNFEKGLTIKKGGYLSNFSAMQLHQITLQIPKTIYVSYDLTDYYIDGERQKLTQENVDKAFSKPQRMSSDIYRSKKDGFRYAFLQKKYKSEFVGVTILNNLSVTDIERTLIDIAIRPAYSGGVFEVLEAFKTSITNKNKHLNIEAIASYLDQLDYFYPYHQLLGFYLEKAGYNGHVLDLFLNKKTNINFYLTYNMSKTLLDEKWGVYYPMGF